MSLRAVRAALAAADADFRRWLHDPEQLTFREWGDRRAEAAKRGPQRPATAAEARALALALLVGSVCLVWAAVLLSFLT